MDTMLKTIQAVLNLLEAAIWVYSWVDDQDFVDACQSLYDEVRPIIFEDEGFAAVYSIKLEKLQAIVNGYPAVADKLPPNWLAELLSAYGNMLQAASA